jgi:hypothetical protein
MKFKINPGVVSIYDITWIVREESAGECFEIKFKDSAGNF